jgi:PAS domain S-box-containing protein
MINLTRLWHDFKQNNIIAYRLLIYIIIFSSTITLLTISFQLYVDYKNDLAIIDEQMEQVQNSRLKSIALSIWEIHYGQLESQLDGILSIRDIEFIQLEMFFEKDVITLGTPPIERYGITKTFEVTIESLGEIKLIGRLKVMASKQNVVSRLKEKVLLIVISQFFKTFLVSIFILLIVYQLVTRHLSSMAHYTGILTLKKLAPPLKLDKKSKASQPDELDKVVHSINSMRRDLITYLNEQEKSQNALLESEAKFQDLYDKAPDMYVSVDAKTALITECNEAMVKAFGYTKEEIIGRSIFTMYSPESAEYAETQVFSEFLKTGEIEGEELQLQRKDGRFIDVLLNASAVRNEQGEILSSRFSWRDIKNRKLAEQKLEASKAYLDKIINNIGDPVFVKDGRHRFSLVNDAFCSTLGLPRDEVIGKTLSEDLPPDEMEHFEKIDRQVLTDGQENLCEELLTVKSGKKLTIVTKKTRYVDENGDKFLVGVIRDITERKEAEEERNKLTTQLHQSQKMESIGNLAGGIAHEFNNMLAIIMGNNELVMEELPQGSLAKESTEEIRIAGLRARDVVKQLLTFSRHGDTVKKVLDFTSVVQESVKLIRSSTPANINIEQNLSADTYPIMGNNTQINQLLINLCNNAVDALPDKGGSVTIELLNETIDIQQIKHQTKLNPGQYAKLIVSDNGIGMDAEILGRVFEPYFTTKDIGQGTGIGMAVVHGIVEKHDGAITVDSKPGQGTTFTIFLPAHEGLFEQETDEQDILPVGDEYILYVDDEPSIAILGKRLLEGLGYTTESTTNPEKALDMVRNDPDKFDLLITDMAMPNMTGGRLVIEILKIRQDMPTIICTGYSANISEKEAADIGVHSYIMKPINKSELAKVVRKVLDGAQSSDLIKP